MMEEWLNTLWHNRAIKNVLGNLVTLGKCLQFLIKEKKQGFKNTSRSSLINSEPCYLDLDSSMHLRSQ